MTIKTSKIQPLNIILLISFIFSTAFQGNLQTTTINITIDAAQNRKTISPYIYGLNFAKETFANEIDLPIRRWGGNTASRYNWQNGNLNTASDWYFENISNSNAYDWSVSEDHNDWVDQNINTDTESLITIPMLGYVAKDASSCGFSVTKYGAQTSIDDPWRPDCGDGINTSGSDITGNNPLDTSISVGPTFMQNWVSDLVDTYGSATNGGVRFYALDNEPELWSDTHRDVHPVHQTYDELLAKSLTYGEAIKTADPDANLLGYVAFGWTGYWYSRRDTAAAAENGYTYFPDYATHGNLYQVEWYLDEMQQYEQTNNLRLLDYLDLHYYPENGVALRDAGDSALQALRLHSTRSLWDPTYRDESWIGGDDQAPDHRYIRLIPRMHNWVNTYYPGTKLAITEYNFGGLEHINGALAQADVLGIFGREGLGLATLWNYPNPSYDPLGYINFETLPGAYAFRMYRNYDGNGSKFGEVSVSAVSTDQSQLAVYAAQRESDSALTIIIINKTASVRNGSFTLQNFQADGIAKVYQYNATNLNTIAQKADLNVTLPNFTAAFPANSITMLVIPLQEGERDNTPPTVDTFSASSPSNSLAVPITSFTASDNIGVTGYLITTTPNQPAKNNANWVITPPTTFTVPNDGNYTLYPWVKDMAGNISNIFETPPTVIVNALIPNVSSIARASTTPTSASSVDFTVTFSEPVTGVDANHPASRCSPRG